MTFIIGLLINLLILALIVVIVLWVLDMLAGALGLPPQIVGIVKAILILIALLMLISTLLGGWGGFYSPHMLK